MTRKLFGTVVTTVMSNMGLDLAIRKAGGKVIRTRVRDRYGRRRG